VRTQRVSDPDVARNVARQGRLEALAKPIGETLAKQAAQELTRKVVTDNLEPILRAQIAKAVGKYFLVVRDAVTGRFLRRAGRKDITHGVKPREELLEAWQKEPSTAAARDLLDRAIDKPKEHVEMDVKGDWDKSVARLARARGRAAEHEAGGKS
jgi:hypothetical protein